MHASWLNQIEIYFSIVQRKVLTPKSATVLLEAQRDGGTGLTARKNGVYCSGPTGNQLVPTFRHPRVSLERGIADPNGARNTKPLKNLQRKTK